MFAVPTACHICIFPIVPHDEPKDLLVVPDTPHYTLVVSTCHAGSSSIEDQVYLRGDYRLEWYVGTRICVQVFHDSSIDGMEWQLYLGVDLVGCIFWV